MNTVICYYPGSGGHRYKNFLLNKEYSKPNKIYDDKHDTYNVRYITDKTAMVDCDNEILLTHCMNSDLVREKIPNSYIIKIVANMKLSLTRGWGSFFKNINHFNSDLDNAFSTIKWHHEYYKQFLPDITADKLVLIDVDTSLFCLTMNKELNNYQNKTFNWAWDIYTQYGPNAPVLDIERNEQK